MGKVFIEESTLTAIGSAIREMTGKNDLIAPTSMPAEIRSIETGGGGGGVDIEPVVLSGNCQYACGGAMASQFIKLFPDKVITNDITDATYMFANYVGKTIPFDINLKNGTNVSLKYTFQNATNLEQIPNITYRGTSYSDTSNVFSGCSNLKNIPYIYNAYPSSIASIFYSCYNLREIPEDYFDTWNFNRINTNANADASSMFRYCYSLRKIPSKLFEELDKATAGRGYYYAFYYNLAYQAYSIDEIIGLPVYINAETQSNFFSGSFDNTSRLSGLTFKTNEDGTPRVVKWKSQTIDMTKYVGFASTIAYILNYNSGITEDKRVVDDATYQALKNDPDWFTTKLEYSRYNHDSAVNTINSLPDTSAYLAEKGGTNTIKFKGAQGSKTDGGAINTLTEEEIAVATAKGWTVSFS